ncbi:Sulfoacetaldehyde acetyltransferase [Geodia barretti]|uniref:Sulfoacetaldehyde acetyltransferase n=1 Tax=Geodia barretti TaxID=519541 RepID=A0AA35X313_GEOBA|nr:Sulfoacetaldehyde acetyltransferase [Geodia barretti]
MISGGGVVMGDAMAETVALAERLGCPVVNSYLHNDSFPASHPLWCGPLGYQGSKAAMRLISRADVVLALGTRLGPFGTLPQHGLEYWPTEAQDVGICGDAGAAAAAITRRLAGRELACDATRTQRAADIAADKAEWESELDDWTEETDDFSVDMIKQAAAESRRLDAPPPGAARA